ncbi:MAG TPA: AraC family transcriptional regulator [Chryseolinea sp.]
MSLPRNYFAIDNPNIPVLPSSQTDIPFGKILAAPGSNDESFNRAVTNVKAYDMYLPNFSLRSFEGKFLTNAVFVNHHAVASELPGSCLFLKGGINSNLPGQTGGRQAHNWSQNFKYDPNNEFVHACEADTDLHFIHFSYTSEYLNQFLPEDQPWADALKKKIAKRERIIGDHFSTITIAQQQALKNILNCPLEGKLGYMMIETSIIQIILIQMHSLFHKEEAFRQPVASRRDVEVIQQLKEHLTRTFLEDHCLSSLARQFGTNTNKLMSLFKKIFGRSIFEFITELRMDHAMQLLRDHGLLVTEVARTVGYKNPNHFSCAFKRRYGINPSGLKVNVVHS